MELTDIDLMLRVRGGDMAAFRELSRRYRAPLHRFFTALLADASQADDFVQETLLRLWVSRERYEPTGKFSTYLFQIGKHYWFNQRKKVCLRLEDLDTADSACGADSPEIALLRRYHENRIRRAVAELPARYQVVFQLCHLDGRKYAEAAAELGIPVGTVKSRMAEAVRRLRDALAPDEEE